MNYKELSVRLVEISKELKKKTISRFKRFKLNREYDKILKKIKATF